MEGKEKEDGKESVDFVPLKYSGKKVANVVQM